VNIKYLHFGLLLAFLLSASYVFGQSGYSIEISIDDYQEEKVFLAEQYGAHQYIIDSAIIENGNFVIQGENSLTEGVYFVVLPPSNEVLQLLIDGDNQHFSLHTNMDYPSFQMKVVGSPLNIDYYAYVRFLAEQRVRAEAVQEELQKARKVTNNDEIQSLEILATEIDKTVLEEQLRIVGKENGSLFSAIVKANLPLEFPDFSNEEQPQYSKYIFTKSHWLDNIDLQDPRMLRTEVLNKKINFYLEQLTFAEADSINVALDFFLGKFKSTPATFEYYLIHFLNKYASAPQIGMDAVYVHLADNYFAKGKAKFADQNQVKKILKEADDMRLTLLGRIAPDIALQEIDYRETLKVKDKKDEKKRWVTKKDFSLSDVKADYTVLFLWSPTCDHCKKSMPEVKLFYEQYKDKGVELVALCNQNYKGIPLCAEYIEEKEIFNWINAIDPYLKSRYKQLFNVT